MRLQIFFFYGVELNTPLQGPKREDHGGQDNSDASLEVGSRTHTTHHTYVNLDLLVIKE